MTTPKQISEYNPFANFQQPQPLPYQIGGEGDQTIIKIIFIWIWWNLVLKGYVVSCTSICSYFDLDPNWMRN